MSAPRLEPYATLDAAGIPRRVLGERFAAVCERLEDTAPANATESDVYRKAGFYLDDRGTLEWETGMEQKRVAVTVTQAVQVGPDKWQQAYQSRVFATTRSIDDMLAWAKSLGFTNPTVNDLQISDYTGESI